MRLFQYSYGEYHIDSNYFDNLDTNIAGFLSTIGCLNNDSDNVDFPKLMSHILKCMGLFLKLREFSEDYQVSAAESKVFLGSVLEMCEFGIATSEGLSFASTRLPAGADLAIHTFKHKNEGVVPILERSAINAGVEVQASSTRSSVWLPLYWAVMSPRWKAPNELQLLMDTAVKSTKSKVLVPSSPLTKETLVHCAAKAVHDNTALLRFLSRRAPRAAFTQDVDGNLPLHAAAQYTESVENLRYLLQLNPKAVRTQNKRGRTPIHVLADRMGRAQLPLLECLLDVANPDDLMIQDELDDTPLHLAWYTWSMKDAVVTKRIFDVNPKAALVANSLDELPIHCIASDGRDDEGVSSTSSISEIEAMVEAMISYFNTINDSNSDDYPLLKPNRWGYTPLHSACVSRDRLPVYWQLVSKLSEACPRAASLFARGNSLTPLKMFLIYCCGQFWKGCDDITKGMCIDTVRKLLDVYPLAASSLSGSDTTYPLHYAARVAPLEIVRMVYDAYPAAVRFSSAASLLPCDLHGTPLHYAASSPFSIEGPKIIRFLYEKYPEAALLSRNGSQSIGTPLHYAVAYSNWEFMKVLCELEPAALKELNAAGETPYQLAVRKGTSSHIQRALLRAAPEVDMTAFRDLNYSARRGALYLMYSAVPCDDSGGAMMIWLKLREWADASLIRTVVSFL